MAEFTDTRWGRRLERMAGYANEPAISTTTTPMGNGFGEWLQDANNGSFAAFVETCMEKGWWGVLVYAANNFFNFYDFLAARIYKRPNYQTEFAEAFPEAFDALSAANAMLLMQAAM